MRISVERHDLRWGIISLSMNFEFFFEIQRNTNDSPKKNIKFKERSVIPQRNTSNSKKETWFPNAGHVSPRGFSYRLLDFLLVTRRVTSKFTNDLYVLYVTAYRVSLVVNFIWIAVLYAIVLVINVILLVLCDNISHRSPLHLVPTFMWQILLALHSVTYGPRTYSIVL